MRASLIVLCSRAGLIRAGVANPAFAAYPLDRFNAAQLKELVAEPAIEVVVGYQINAEGIDAFIAENNPPAEAIGTGAADTEGKVSAANAGKGKTAGKTGA
jgi:hypothetical protein